MKKVFLLTLFSCLFAATGYTQTAALPEPVRQLFFESEPFNKPIYLRVPKESSQKDLDDTRAGKKDTEALLAEIKNENDLESFDPNFIGFLLKKGYVTIDSATLKCCWGFTGVVTYRTKYFVFYTDKFRPYIISLGGGFYIKGGHRILKSIDFQNTYEDATLIGKRTFCSAVFTYTIATDFPDLPAMKKTYPEIQGKACMNPDNGKWSTDKETGPGVGVHINSNDALDFKSHCNTFFKTFPPFIFAKPTEARLNQGSVSSNEPAASVAPVNPNLIKNLRSGQHTKIYRTICTSKEDMYFVKVNFNLRTDDFYCNKIKTYLVEALRKRLAVLKGDDYEKYADDSITYIFDIDEISAKNKVTNGQNSSGQSVSGYTTEISYVMTLKRADDQKVMLSHSVSDWGDRALYLKEDDSFYHVFNSSDWQSLTAKLVLAFFPPKALVLTIDDKNSKGEATALTINEGYDIGIPQPGILVSYFMNIYEIKGDEMILIGKVKIKDVNFDSSKCKVTEGGALIAEKFASGAKLKAMMTFL